MDWFLALLLIGFGGLLALLALFAIRILGHFHQKDVEGETGSEKFQRERIEANRKSGGAEDNPLLRRQP